MHKRSDYCQVAYRLRVSDTLSFPLRGPAVSFSQPQVLQAWSTTTGSLYDHQPTTSVLKNRSASQRRVSKSLVFSYMVRANAADGAREQFKFRGE